MQRSVLEWWGLRDMRGECTLPDEFGTTGGTLSDLARRTASGRDRHAQGVEIRVRATVHVAVAAAFAVLLGGCAGGSGVSTAALPSLPSLPKIALPEAPPPVVGSATEVYERIGRGAMACWFGAGGMLKPTHIYDATAEPANKGGKAEIVIRERDNSAESPRGVKAFRITIAPSSEDETNVVAENLKLPEATATQMKKAVAAWSIGHQGCDPDAVKGAWQAGAGGQSDAAGTTGSAQKTAKKQKATQPKR